MFQRTPYVTHTLLEEVEVNLFVRKTRLIKQWSKIWVSAVPDSRLRVNPSDVKVRVSGLSSTVDMVIVLKLKLKLRKIGYRNF
jgi:hypothetical protein